MDQHLKLEDGFRFRPTDSEGLMFLLRFVAGQEMHDSGFITTNVDVYGKQEPWEIYDNGVPCGDDEDSTSYRYFITKLKKKSNARYHRSVGNKGTWKQDAKDKPVHYKNMGNTSSVVNIGSKTCLSYKNKKFYPEDQKDGHWLMKEYKLSKVILHKFDEERRDYVLCAIKNLNHVNSSSETFTITALNNISDGTDEVTSSVDGLLATKNCKDYYNMCKNLEHSETMAFQESMVMNNSVDEAAEGTTFEMPELEVPEDLYQWDGKELDELNQILDGVPEVDVAVEPLAAVEPEATYTTWGQHSVEATCMPNLDPSMPTYTAHIEYSEVADMSQIHLEHYSATMAFQESHEAVESMVMNNSVEPTEGTTFEVPELQVPDDLYQWDGKEFDEQNQMLYDVPEVDVEVNIAERLAATMEPTEATYPAEATDMLNVDQSVSDNSVHVHYSEVAAFEKGQGQQGCAADYEEQLYWLSRMELEDTCYEMLEPNEAFQLAP